VVVRDLSRARHLPALRHASARVAGANGVPVRRTDRGLRAGFRRAGRRRGLPRRGGQEGRLTQAFYQGYGFSGILIAFLARNNPIAATVVALLVAVLFVAGRSLQVFYQVPFAMVQLIQAIIVIAVACSDFFIRHRLRRVGAGD
jgi:hypothetical protein